MLRASLTLLLAASAARPELRSMLAEFSPSDCAACTESLPERLKRIRGVARAELIPGERPVLKIEFSTGNRVRPGRVRETIEQDGTKWLKARVEASGDCEQRGGEPVIKLFDGDSGVPLKGRTGEGPCSVKGILGADGVLVIE